MPNAYDRYLAGLDAQASYVPPNVPASQVEPPRLMTDHERQRHGAQFLHHVMGALGALPKGAASAFSMTVEGLSRVDDAFQVTVATAFGRIPTKDYPRYVTEVMDGTRKVPGTEWMRIMLGQETWDAIKDSTLIPGWTKQIIATDTYLAHKTGYKPLLTWGNFLGFLSDAVVSPWTFSMVLPKNFFTATTLGKALAGPELKAGTGIHVGLNPASSVVTYPMRWLGHELVGRTDRGLGALLMHLRDPVSVFRGAMRRDAVNAGEDLNAVMDGLSEKLIKVGHKHRALSAAEKASVWEHHWIRPTQLSPGAQELYNDMKPILEEAEIALQANGYTIRKVSIGGAVVRKPWSLATDELRDFIPNIKSFTRTANRTEARFKTQMQAYLPWRKTGLPFNPATLHDLQKDPIHAAEQWLSQVYRKTTLEARERVGNRWVRRGLINKYRPVNARGDFTEDYATMRAGAQHVLNTSRDAIEREAAQEMLGLNQNEFRYLKDKWRDYTGHRVGKMELMLDNVMEATFSHLETVFKTLGQHTRLNRVTNYFLTRAGNQIGHLGQPVQGRTSAIAGLMTRNLIVATLGGNLGSAIRNTSQLLNIAAVEGMPAMIKGIYRIAQAHLSPGETSRTLQAIRHDLRLRAGFRRLLYDESWSSGGQWTVGQTMADKLLGPFTAVENLMRGTAATVAAERELKRLGIRTLAQYQALGPGAKQALLRTAREAALDTNFIYGIAGRSHIMMHPALRIGTSLQSFSWKQGEFIARAMQRDGSAVVRLFALNGYFIDMMDQYAGINAENWLGWGFLPPSSIYAGSPIVEAWQSLSRATYAASTDDLDTYDKEVNRVRGYMRDMWRAFGMSPDNQIETQAILGGMANAGLLPVPIVALGKTVRATNAFFTGRMESSTGRSWIPVTRSEAITSAFFTTHVQAEDAKMRAMTKATKSYVDRELDRRTRRFVQALNGKSGDALMEAADQLYSPITFRTPLSASQNPVVKAATALGMDEHTFNPHPEMIERRMNNMLVRQALPTAVVEMLQAGWAMEVLWQPYTQNGLDALERMP